MEFQLRPSKKILAELDDRTGIFGHLLTSAGAAAGEFENRYVPLIEGLAAYLLEAPLERTAFAEPAGALRFGLTSAVFGLRQAMRCIFAPTMGMEVRRGLDKQYKFAVFAATLATVPTLVHTKIQVSAGPANTVWSPFHSHPHLEDWVPAVGGGRTYEVLWRTSDAEYKQSVSVAISAEIFKRGFWGLFHPMVVHDMYDAIAPQSKRGAEGPLWLCVYEGMRLCRQNEQNAETAPYVPGEMPAAVTPENLAVTTPPTAASSSLPSDQQPAAAPGIAPTESAAANATPAPPPTPTAPWDSAASQPAEAPTTAPTPANVSEEVQRAITVAKKLPPHIQEFFSHLPAKPDYEKLKADFRKVEGGIEVPLKMLYGSGVNPSKLLEELKSLDLFVSKSAAGGAARITLVPEVEYLLNGEALAHV